MNYHWFWQFDFKTSKSDYGEPIKKFVRDRPKILPFKVEWFDFRSSLKKHLISSINFTLVVHGSLRNPNIYIAIMAKCHLNCKHFYGNLDVKAPSGIDYTWY